VLLIHSWSGGDAAADCADNLALTGKNMRRVSRTLAVSVVRSALLNCLHRSRKCTRCASGLGVLTRIIGFAMLGNKKKEMASYILQNSFP